MKKKNNRARSGVKAVKEEEEKINKIKKAESVIKKDIEKTLDFLKLKHPVAEAPKTFDQKSADALTKWAGSWAFIIGFLVFLVLWMAANVYAWMSQWDPYPFILLNLVLSCIAAIQAPIILMSQNREAHKDRLHAQYDYAVNRKAEREIQEIILTLQEIKQKMK